MKPAWRGVVIDGDVWAWPTLLMTHAQAFAVLPHLENHTCRWRQWDADGPIDFDPGVSDGVRTLVEDWVADH